MCSIQSPKIGTPQYRKSRETRVVKFGEVCIVIQLVSRRETSNLDVELHALQSFQVAQISCTKYQNRKHGLFIIPSLYVHRKKNIWKNKFEKKLTYITALVGFQLEIFDLKILHYTTGFSQMNILKQNFNQFQNAAQKPT